MISCNPTLSLTIIMSILQLLMQQQEAIALYIHVLGMCVMAREHRFNLHLNFSLKSMSVQT